MSLTGSDLHGKHTEATETLSTSVWTILHKAAIPQFVEQCHRQSEVTFNSLTTVPEYSPTENGDAIVLKQGCS